MRILMVSEDLPAQGMGGLARHVLALSRALVAAGHQVDLMGNDDELISATGEALDIDGHFIPALHGQFDGWKEFALGSFIPYKRSVIAHRFARAILRRAGNYDVIHYHGHLPNIAYFIPSNINFIQTRHDQGSDCLIHTRFTRGQICRATDPGTCAQCRSERSNRLQRSVSAIAVRQYRAQVAAGFKRHKTVFVSDFLRRNVARTFGPGPWGVTVHNFIDTRAVQTARTMSGRWSDDDRLQVFIAAKLYAAKGVTQFLETLTSPQYQRLDISVAGDGPDLEALSMRFPYVDFLGWRSGVESLQLAAGAQAIVVPSICEEACASTIIEGLLLGKTVFALNLGGTPELQAYESAPMQLRLYPAMVALVEGLLAFQPHPDFALSPRTPTGSAEAAGRLLALYRLPPGPITH
jgi:glycosyltransferase involved in cell wall biosynthesis